MDGRLAWAVRNNASWCDLVCRSHGIKTSFGPDLWVAAERTPTLYPDAVTLREQASEETVLTPIALGPSASVKDSYATLDLARHGFDELSKPAGRPVTRRRRTATGPSWRRQRTRRVDRGRGPEQHPHPDLLRHANVRFLAADDRHGISAGAVANLTDTVVGVSNVFVTTIGEDEAWAAIPAQSTPRFPRRALVGYEHDTGLRAAIPQGSASSARFASGSRLKRPWARARRGPSSRAGRWRPLRGR